LARQRRDGWFSEQEQLGVPQPYGSDFLIRLDSFAVRNLAGTTLLTMNLFRPFPLHDRARHSIAKMGCKPKAAMATLQNAREQWEFLAAFSNLNSNASVKAHI